MLLEHKEQENLMIVKQQSGKLLKSWLDDSS
jgi:hypothetical protein